MQTENYTGCYNVGRLRAVLIAGAVAIGLTGSFVIQAVAQDRERGGDYGRGMGGGMGGGIGTGVGIGIGIGIGQGLSQQPAAQPQTPPTSKKTTRSNVTKQRQSVDKPATVEQKPAMIFVGKPDSVPYDAKQKEGKLGDLNDHKQVAVSKDRSYFIRHYYFVHEGDQRSWYYYDVPDTTAQHKDVPSCNADDDDCDGPPQHPIYVDNPPALSPGPVADTPAPAGGPGESEEGEGPPCGKSRVRSAWTECKGGFVHQMETSYNYCPPKTKWQVFHQDISTETVCGADGFTGGGNSATLPNYPLGKGCTYVRTDFVPFIGGSDWYFHVVDIYTCPGEDGEFREPRETEKRGNAVADGPPTIKAADLPPMPEAPK